MILFLNGAFGIGKSTVARLLRERLPGSAIYDPELAGMLLMRLPRWFALEGRGTDDFQDIALWRRATVAGIRAVRALRGTVIVPMAFTRVDYLHEIREGAVRSDGDVRHVCLVAPLAVVEQRLAARGGVTAWQRRRAAECCAAHGAAAFAEQIDAAGRTAEAVAEAIAAAISR